MYFRTLMKEKTNGKEMDFTCVVFFILYIYIYSIGVAS